MSEHIDLESLAALADGSLSASQADLVRAHLGECRSCMAAYVDAVRYRAAWLVQPASFGIESAPADPAGRSLWRRGRVVAPIAAAVALVAALVNGAREPSSPSLGQQLPPATRQAIERASSRGLVLPGGESAASRPVTEQRSGLASPTPELDREVAEAVEAYSVQPNTVEEDVRVVAALLASGETQTAAEYARECLERRPDNVRLRILAADACYRSGDLAGAESMLRLAATKHPDDVMVLLDLAIVLRASGRGPEAQSLLRRAARSKHAELSARAKAELAGR